MNTRNQLGAVLITLIAICIFASDTVYGTAQESDVLFLDGKARAILTNPLEEYLSEHPEKRPTSGSQLTSLWRGYVAKWDIVDDMLSLADITVRQIRFVDGESWPIETASVLSEVFPRQDSVPATWYTGYIIVPDGKRIEYVHMGYGSTYKRYIVLTVREGRVTQREHFRAKEFREFRLKQFELYRKTDEYKNELAKLQDGSDRTKEELEDFLFEFLSERYTNLIFDPVSQPAD
jgi:hypothetical protein